MSKTNYRIVVAALLFLTCAHAMSGRVNGQRPADSQTSAGWVSLSPKGEEFAVALPEPPVVLGSSEVDRKALIVLRREAVYTDEARRRGVHGVVAVRAVLAASGKVTDVEVVRGLPHGLNESALEATREIKFVPASKNGAPVSQRVLMEYAFNYY